MQEALSGRTFVERGQQWVAYFKELCGLTPDEHVLDVGCGRGRIAVPLTQYLTTGCYEGFDIDRAKVSWCRENISSRFPNFSFQSTEVFSAAYNREGSIPGDKYRFPYRDARFDFVFIVTVLNTMEPAAVENYLRESARVLKPGGRLLATFQLLNDEALRLLREKADQLHPSIAALNSGPDFGDYRFARADTPEAGVALREEFAFELMERAGLHGRRPPFYGAWPGRETSIVAGHDFIVADRADRP